jgi:tripartite-type tricarboxylate transporter receptor subunit TctC
MLLGAALAAPALPALAQGEWPTRPVRIIVAQPAGGNLDILVRAVAEGLRQVLGQNFIVENRAGGQGVIGLEACANAAPDGTTVCAVNIENMSTAPHVLPELYARYASLRPVTEIATAQAVLVGSLEVPAGATLREFVAWARGRPGLNYGSSGVGSAQQLIWEWIKAREGLQMEHVPFRGISDAFRELVGGRLHASYGALALAMPLIREGRIRALAVLGSERVAELPDTPSMVELGYNYPYAGPWWGFAAPGGVRDDIVERLAAATRRVVRDEEFRRRALAPHYFSGVGSTPQEFGALIARQREESVELLRLSGLLPAR